MLRKQLRGRENRSGSNAWAVSGEFTSSGYPVIANDPHLTLDVPSVFTEDHIIVTGANGFSASGVSVPGTPGIIQGCTSALCWGSTVHPMDVTDTYQETLKLNRLGLPVASIYQGQEEPITLIFQTYFANNPQDGDVNSVSRANVPLDGGGITFVVPRRNNGPIVDVDGSTGISVQYTGWGPTFELQAFREINRATSIEQFEAALQKFDVGSQNFVYADIDGNIAYFTSAENPIRADLQNDMAPDGGIPPFLIRNGSGQLNHEWLSVQNPQPDQAVPFEIMPWAEMPKDINPERGYVANANNDPIGVTLDNNPLNQLRPGGGLYYLNPGYASLRMGRVDRVLQDLVAGGNVTRQDMITLQANNQMLDAEILHPIVVGTLAGFVQPPGSTCPAAFPDAFACDPRMQQALQLLSAWDFSTPTGIQAGYDPGDDPANLPAPSASEINHSVAATLFATIRGQLIENSLDAILDGSGLGDFKPGSQLTWNALIRQLVDFDELQGFGESGVPLLFDPNNPPQGVDARSQLIIGSVISSLLLLESDEFAPAFANSQDIMDYRWGLLHRIVLNHPLDTDPFNIPNGGGLSDLAPDLRGLARSGGYQVVDASTHSVRANGLNEFMFGSGPARRFVGTMTPAGPDGLEVIPGGRSSVPFSPFFADQMPLWLTNDFHELTITSAQAQSGALVTTTFSPE
jgi:penicillin amidase